jgi:hypothetical protein
MPPRPAWILHICHRICTNWFQFVGPVLLAFRFAKFGVGSFSHGVGAQSANVCPSGFQCVRVGQARHRQRLSLFSNRLLPSRQLILGSQQRGFQQSFLVVGYRLYWQWIQRPIVCPHRKCIECLPRSPQEEFPQRKSLDRYGNIHRQFHLGPCSRGAMW